MAEEASGRGEIGGRNRIYGTDDDAKVDSNLALQPGQAFSMKGYVESGKIRFRRIPNSPSPIPTLLKQKLVRESSLGR